MTASISNLLASIPASGDREFTSSLVSGRHVRLKRIISFGQASPDGFWYDQTEAEWVAVLAGRARLAIDGRSDEVALGPGDAIFLPAHCRHRILWTDPNQPTVWLALFIDAELKPTQHEVDEK